jgi:putative DNA primase/helicase
MWNGFAAKLMPEECIDYKKIEAINHHIKVVWADNDDHIFNYIISWFNHIFTKPYKKTRVIMGFKSTQQQIGKSTLVEEFLNPFIFGRKLSSIQSGLDFINNRFNWDMAGKIFTSCEELSSLSNQNNYSGSFDKLKQLITGKTIRIEIKGGPVLELDDFNNFMFFTNHDFTVKIEKDDARFFVAECNPIYFKNYEYFNNLFTYFNQECANHWFSWVFHKTDCLNILDIPKTKLKKDMQINSLSSPLRYLQKIKVIREMEEEDAEELENWQRVVYEWESLINGTELYSIYKSYCRDENEKEVSSTRFGRDITNVIIKRRSNGMKYDLNSIKIV